MEHVGIDLGKRQSQVCTLTEDGELKQRRILTTRDRITAVFGKRAPTRILIEACAGSEWVARVLEELGHEVIVADPNYAPMYVHRTRRIKTDKRDAEALALACREGHYRPAHRLSDEQRLMRTHLAVRRAMVETRAGYISAVGAQLWLLGIRVPSGSLAGFASRVAKLELPVELRYAVEPLLDIMRELNDKIESANAELKTLVESCPTTRRLTTVVGVGPVTASTFVSVIDTVERFSSARELAAYVGLVPREWSSSESQRRGSITKAGNTRLRTLLVEAAWTVLRCPKPETAALRDWALRIAGRRGKAKAAVALARRLSRILYAMWRDASDYDPSRLAGRAALPSTT